MASKAATVTHTLKSPQNHAGEGLELENRYWQVHHESPDPMTEVFPSRDWCPYLSLSHTFPCPSSRGSNLGGHEKLEFPSGILTRNLGHFLLLSTEKMDHFCGVFQPLNGLISFCVAFIRRFHMSVCTGELCSLWMYHMLRENFLAMIIEPGLCTWV